MTEPQPGQIPCPSCGQPLSLPLEAVLAGQPIICRACGVELTTKREASRESLIALRRWYDETKEARAVASDQTSTAAEESSRRRRRRRG